jgi:phosphatidylglycerol:prolipoprotein diacylglycerol transferase
MRPRLVDWLAGVVGPGWAEWLIPAPSTFYAFAMIAMLIVFVRRSRQTLGSSGDAAATAFWAMLGGLVGARVFYWIQHGLFTDMSNWRYLLTAGGTASWGVYLGTALALIAYLRLRRAPVLPVLDVAASVAGLGIAIGRLSCFLNGDDYGTISAIPWSIRFPSGSYPFAAQVRDGVLDPSAALSLGVHPVQLYLALNGLILFWVTSALWRRYRDNPGLTLAMYIGLYAAMRFGLEFFRGDQDRYTRLQLSVPQIMSLAALWVSVAVLAGWRLGWLGHVSPRRSITTQAT